MAQSGAAVRINLAETAFDAFGRALIGSRKDAAALRACLDTADAIALSAPDANPACAPVALLRTEQLIRLGGALLVDDYAFAALVRQAKATDAPMLDLAVTPYRDAA